MSLRFHCEHCGKRLQVDLPAGTTVGCPFCHGAVVVPADAAAAGPRPAGAESDELTWSERATDAAATYVPSWGASVMVHMALVLVALFGTWMAVAGTPELDYATDVRETPDREFTRRNSGSRTTRAPKTLKTSSMMFRQTTRPKFGLDAGEGEPDVIGLGPGGGMVGGMLGLGDFRNPGGPRGEPGIFPPLSPDKRRIVYVVDRSGSMTDTVHYVKWDLKRAIGRLRPSQMFHVIFYSSGPPKELVSRGLVPATEANKQLAYEFIDSIVPTSQTDPSDALKRAFALKPDTVYFLTDGEFDKAIRPLVRDLNRDVDAQVDTIAFLYGGAEELLQGIAHDNGGAYRFIGENDLKRLVRSTHD